MADNRALRTSCSLLDRLRLRPDDPEAWAEPYTATDGSSMVSRLATPDADAQDVTQNVSAQTRGQNARFCIRPIPELCAWLKTVTGHALSDYLDACRRQGTVGDGEVATRLENLEARQGLERVSKKKSMLNCWRRRRAACVCA